jgi:hypothetical protein
MSLPNDPAAPLWGRNVARMWRGRLDAGQDDDLSGSLEKQGERPGHPGDMSYGSEGASK